MRAAAVLLAAACVAGAAHAQDIRARQNLEYRLIAPQPVETGDRIEVIDFFWYGCPYCNELQPALERWIRRKPADVALRRVPAILRDSWAPHARIFYTLEALGEVDRLHLKVYESYHIERLHMSEPDVVVEWAAKNGIDRKRWLEAYGSSAIDAKVQHAKELSAAYTVRVTPTLVVNGRYLTSGNHVPCCDVGDIVPILEDMIRLARQQRSRR
ncbi:MAG TPA: thiol:disulfide interchange protein DsbA/DsbL [Burkholderiales bacterium]|nr:thiol:disulfide interchange protein DsbA/DsbL [Burkholderiales bacterium]